MSEQIREQVSAFLDGELPGSETELLLKRLTRDSDLRESFGRYALIGEALRASGRGADRSLVSRGFSTGVNAAIDGEPAPAASPLPLNARQTRWWRPVAGAAVAAGVAAVAVVALQQRAVSPALRAVVPMTAQVAPKEALSYTVPAATGTEETPAMLPAARLTSYVFAHSRYSSVLGQSNVLSGLLSDDQSAAQDTSPATPAVNAEPRPPRDSRIAP